MTAILDEFKITTPQPLREKITSILRKSILNGDFPPGKRLIETDLADRLGVSRMPVREARRMLENEGLVKLVPKKGLLVTKFTEQDIREIYAVREALEAYAITEVVNNATEDELQELESYCDESEEAAAVKDYENLYKALHKFNAKLFMPCRIGRMVRDINKSQEYLQSFRIKAMRSEERAGEAMREHRDIINALREKNTDKAVKVVKKHLQNSLKSYLKTLSEKRPKRP